MSSGAGPADLIFPSGVDIYSTKVDRGIVISGESHVIPSSPYQFYLDYVPLQTSPTSTHIGGYVEVSGTPATFQYNTVYSGVNAGLMTFNPLQSGLSVNVTYTAFGDIIEAEYINSLQSSIENVEAYVLANVASGSFLHTSGGTVTGTVLMNGNLQLGSGEITSTTSGTNSIGANGVPMSVVYTDSITTNQIDSTSLAINVNGPITISGSTIYESGSFVPLNSGVSNLGASSSAWNYIYVNTLGSNITLASGVNVVVYFSGSNSIGSAGAPVGSIYADNIVSPSIGANLSGSFVHKAGDSMSGSLTIASGAALNAWMVNNLAGPLTLSGSTFVQLATDLIPVSSGVQNLGSATNPYNVIYASSIYGASGNFVQKTGDTMQGNLTFPNGTVLNVYTITSSDPSGNINVRASQLNVDVTSNVSFTSVSNQIFEIGLAGVYINANFIPNASGAFIIGSPALPFSAIYADNFYATNLTTNLVNSTITGNLTMLSGSSIIPIASGVGNIGTSGNPIGTIYASNIVFPNTSGVYLSKTGDTLGGNYVPSASGLWTVGSQALPLSGVFANNLIYNSGGSFFGPVGFTTLYAVSGVGNISGNTLNLTGQQVNVNAYNGPAIINGKTEVQLNQNGNAGFAVTTSGNYTFQNIYPNVSGSINLGSPSLSYGTIYANSIVSANGTSGTFVSKFGDSMTGNLTMAGANVLTSASGTGTVGANGVPFQAVYTNSINGIPLGNLISGTFVRIAGDTMSGTLIMHDGTNIIIGTTNVISGAFVSDSFLVGNLNTISGNMVSSIVAGESNISNVTIDSILAGFNNSALNSSQYQLFGVNNQISGANWSTTFGVGNNVKSQLAFVAGTVNTVGLNGSTSAVFGTNNLVNGQADLAVGTNNVLSGTSALIFGYANSSNANQTLTGGDHNLNAGIGAVVFGTNNVASGQYTTIVNGAGNTANANAQHSFIAGVNNNLYNLETAAIGGTHTVSGLYAMAVNKQNSAGGQSSFAAGEQNLALGNWSTTFGYQNQALGQYSVAGGQGSIAYDNYTFALGYQNTAVGDYAQALGHSTTASGNFAHTFGNHVFAAGSGTMALGDGQAFTYTGTQDNTLYLRFLNGVVLTSGTNLVPEASGVQNLGSSSLWYNNVYVNNINGSPFIPFVSGNYVSKAGDSMSGPLTMLFGGTINAGIISGNSTGANQLTFIASSGANISGTITVNPLAVRLQTQDVLNTGPAFIDILADQNGGVDRYIHLDTGATAQFMLSPSGLFATSNASTPLTVQGSQQFLRVTTSGTYMRPASPNVSLAVTNNEIDTHGNILPLTSGTDNLGSASLPYSGVFASSVSIGNYVIPRLKVNEVPSGLINSSNKNYTLVNNPIQGSTQIFYNGIYMIPSGIGAPLFDYTLISGNVISFGTPPVSGATLIAMQYSY